MPHPHKEKAARSRLLTVATQNVQQAPPMPQDHVVSDVNATASVSGVILWQEVHPDRYKAAVADLDPNVWTTYFPPSPDGGVPISWKPARWVYIDSGQSPLHDGDPAVCNARTISWVELRDKRTGALVILNNTHYVSSAWSGTKPNTARRMQLWQQGNRAHKALVKGWVKAGYLVIGGGDYNSTIRRYPPMGKRIGGAKVHYMVPESSIDMLWVVAGGKTHVWHVIGSSTEPKRFSDHPGRLALVRIIRSK